MVSSSRSKLWLLFTVVVGIVTSLLIGQYLKATQEVVAESKAVATVVVASQKIPQWTKITQNMLKTKQIPQKSLPEKALTDPIKVVGQYSTGEIIPEEVITSNRVASDKTSSDLVYKIPAGYRAITIAIDSVQGVAGLMKPDNRVDILMTYSETSSPIQSKTITLTQNSLVLAVGGGGAALKEGEPPPPLENITIAVTPQEAEYIMWSETTGKMKLTLRPTSDKNKVDIKSVDLNKIKQVYP